MSINLPTLLLYYFLSWMSSWIAPVALLDAFLRSTFLLALALLAGFFVRHRRAEWRLLIYRSALLGVFAIALFGLTANKAAPWRLALYSAPNFAAPVASVETISTPLPTVISPAAPSNSAAPKAIAAAPQTATTPLETARDKGVDRLLNVLIIAWPLLAFCLLLRLFWHHGKIVWLRHGAQKVTDENVLALLHESCDSVGVQAPRLLSSARAGSPFLCGIWHPAIVLPIVQHGDSAPFSEADLRAIFLHEAAHLRHKDCAWIYARRLLGALFWPQPLLWILVRQMEIASEEACDLAVLESGYAPRDYAQCLLRLTEGLCLSKTERAVGVGVVPLRSQLGRRVQKILRGVPQGKAQGAKYLSRRARWSLAALALCLAAASVAVAVDADTPLLPTGTISGRVIYKGGKPAANLAVVVDLQDDDDLRLRQKFGDQSSRRFHKMLGGEAKTAANGTYRISGLLAGGTFNIMLHNGFSGSQMDAGPSGWVGAAQTVKPQQNKALKVKDIVLTHGAIIQGRVEDAISHRTLKGISVGAHGPHRPLSTGMISGTVTDANGLFSLRVPPGKNWLYVNGPVQNYHAEVHFGGSTPYEKELGVIKTNVGIYGQSDFIEVRVDGGAPRYTRSGNGGLREADSIVIKEGQTRRMTFRLRPLMIRYRADGVPIVTMSRELPKSSLFGTTPISSVPMQGKGIIAGKILTPDGKPLAGVKLIVRMQEATRKKWNLPGTHETAFGKLPPGQSAMLLQNVVTQADGTYRIDGLAEAPYDIIFHPWIDGKTRTDFGWIAPPLSGIEARDEQTVTAPNLIATRGGIIKGRVVDNDEKLLPNLFSATV